MRLQLYRLVNVALTSFVVDVFAVLETCMLQAVLLILFFLRATVDRRRSRR